MPHLASTGVSGIAAGNIFHFTELSYPRAKKLLIEEGCNVRK
jgi:imidazole glycerol phosphate synthase subunit HisF